jgi:hypothetical protein
MLPLPSVASRWLWRVLGKDYERTALGVTSRSPAPFFAFCGLTIAWSINSRNTALALFPLIVASVPTFAYCSGLTHPLTYFLYCDFLCRVIVAPFHENKNAARLNPMVDNAAAKLDAL